MKGLYGCLLLILFSSAAAFSQTITSAQDGDWDQGSTWVGGVIPTAANSTAIQIDHNVTIPSTYTAVADQITVAASITFTISGTLNLQNSGGTDLMLAEDFVFLFVGANLVVNGDFINNSNSDLDFGFGLSLATFNSGGRYVHAVNGVALPPVGTVWNEGSTCEIQGVTNSVPTNLNQTFYNLTWNCPGHTSNLIMDLTSSVINGDLSILNTNGSGALTLAGGPGTVDLNGNFIVSGNSRFIGTLASNVTIDLDGSFSFSSSSSFPSILISTTGTLNFFIGGDFSFSSGTLLARAIASATTNIIFDGNSAPPEVPQTFNISGGTLTNNFNWRIFNGSGVDMGTSAFTNPGSFTLDAGAYMYVGSPDGLSTGTSFGNVRVGGARNYIANGNIIYNGAIDQNLGTEWGPTGALDGIAVNLEIANTGPNGVTNNIVGSTSLVGNLTLTTGSFNIGNTNTLQIESNFIGNGGTIGGETTSNLTFSGFGSTTGSLDFTAGAENLDDFTLARTGSITVGTDLTIHGILAFTNSGNLLFDGQTLTVNGDITQSGAGGLAGDNASDLIIGGTGSLTSLPFCTSCGTVELNDVTLAKGGTYTWNSAATINGTVALNSGTLTHTSGLIMAEGSTFIRNSGTSMTNSSPIATGSYNVTYNGVVTTGLELPSGTTALDNLTISGDATLTKTITINGDLNINSGSFNASTFNIVMAGPNFNANGGNFTINSGNSVTFARAGTTVMSGSTIENTQFGTLTINSGATLSAPNANINIAGTWDNLGTFTPNSGTVTFNGASQNVDPNGQPFNNVVFGGSGTKELQGTLDVNGSLTITSTLDAGANQPINIAGFWINNGTFIAKSGTVTFDGNLQNINSNGQAFYNLTLANGGTKTLGAAINIDAALTIDNGVTFDVTSGNYAVNLAGNWVNNGTFNRRTGSVTFDGNTVISGTASSNFHSITIAGILTASSGLTNIHGNWQYSSGTFNSNGGTVQFLGGDQSITSGGQPFNHVVIGGTNTKTLLGNIDINGDLTLSSLASTFHVGLNNTVNLAGNFNASGGGILNAQTGRFIFDGSTQTITSAGQSFHHAEFSGSGTKTIADAFDANGDMDINVALAAGSNAVAVGGNWDAQGGSFTSTGITTFNGAAQNIRSSGSAFGALTIAGTGTKTLQDALDANGNLTVTATLDVSTSNFAITAGGNWDTSLGTFTARTGLVTLDGAAQNISTGLANSFNHLTLAGSAEKTQLNALDINGNLVINTNSGLNAGTDNNLTLAGNLTTNGTYIPGASTLLLDGTAAQSLAGTTVTNFNNITVNKTSGTTTVSTSQNLTNTLTLTAGILNANGMLTLVSNASGDARIAEITGGSIIGDVIAQRYLPVTSTPPAGGVYRYFASPVTDAFVSDWKDDFPITGTFNDPSTQVEWPGLNVTPTARNMFFYNEAHVPTASTEDRYETYPLNGTSSTAAALVNGRGYSARVRQTAPITLDVTGTPQTGNVPVSVTAQSGGGNDGWNLIGNPYPAPINWDNVNLPAGVNTQIALKDNANNSGIGVGQYVYYTQGGDAIPDNYTGAISSGQAFWVRATSNAVITFEENDKQPIADPDFIRSMPLENILRISVLGNSHRDEIIIRFADEASDKADSNYDAFKLQNDFINFSSLSADSLKMAINVLGGLSCNKEIGLVIDNVTAGSYSFNFTQFESFREDIQIRLLDAFTGTTFDLRSEEPVYQFNVTDDVNTFGKNRFKVYVTYPEVETALSLIGEDVCLGSHASITVENSQNGVKYYSTINGNTVSDEVVSDGGEVQLTVAHDKLSVGENTIVLMGSIGGCSAIPLDNPVIVSTDKIYEITSASNGKSCGAGQVSLSAEGAPENGSYQWYEAIDDVTPIAGQTGAEFITPVLDKTKTYYVSAVNALGCEGGRSEVSAEVTQFEGAEITVLENGALRSNYPDDNQWYLDNTLIPGATSQEIVPDQPGTYTIKVDVSGCTTSADYEFSVTGLEEGALGSIRIYPNPVENRFNVVLNNTEPAGAKIFNSAGKPIGSIRFMIEGSQQKGEFYFENEASGLYLMRITQGKKVINYKIIKK